MKVHGTIIVFSLFLVALAAPAVGQQQQPPCTDRTKMAEHLNSKYHESQTGAGLQSRSRIIEVWASEGGTWTIVATDARGVSCILASGTHWRNAVPVKAIPGVDG